MQPCSTFGKYVFLHNVACHHTTGCMRNFTSCIMKPHEHPVVNAFLHPLASQQSSLVIIPICPRVTADSLAPAYTDQI